MFSQFYSRDFELHVKSVFSPGAWEQLAERRWGPRGELPFPYSAPPPALLGLCSPGLEGRRAKNGAKLLVFGPSLKVSLSIREVFRGSQRPTSAHFGSLYTPASASSAQPQPRAPGRKPSWVGP